MKYALRSTPTAAPTTTSNPTPNALLRVLRTAALTLGLLGTPLWALAAELPTEQGEGEVSSFIDANTGGRMDIGGGFVVEIPPGIDFGTVVTFSKTKDRPSEKSVAAGFKRHGATLSFDAEERGLKEGIVVAIGIKRNPVKNGQRFVLAMELSGECAGAAKKQPLEGGGCSHWKIVDTEFDKANKRVIARLTDTGGYRLQFGWLPR